MEEWKQINQIYSVSNMGKVRNNNTLRILKPFRMGEYLGVHLGYGNKHYIHRLVASAFLTVDEERRYIDHIDRDRFNNQVSNLRYVTCKENTANTTPFHNRKCNGILGQKYIKKTFNKYVVFIHNRLINCRASFDNLDEAIAYRDKQITPWR